MWHVKAERADRWTPRLFRCPSLIKSSSCSWPRVARRTLFWHWQFMLQDWAAIHHSRQVKPCAQSVYIHNYVASTCPWAARVQEHLLGRAQAGGRRRSMGDLSGGNKSTVIGVAVMCVSVSWEGAYLYLNGRRVFLKLNVGVFTTWLHLHDACIMVPSLCMVLSWFLRVEMKSEWLLTVAVAFNAVTHFQLPPRDWLIPPLLKSIPLI